MTRRFFAALVLVALASGCARAPKPSVTPRGPALPQPGTLALQQDLTALFRAPAFASAIWGVQVRSLKSGESLFALNPQTLLMPASNMKLVTSAVAVDRLGWDYTFETSVLATGAIENGVIHGDLMVVGSGDPSLGGRPLEARSVFDTWAATLREQGITVVDGRIIGDDNAFDDRGLGAGWAWDYLAYGYATPAGALTYNENVVQVTIRPGSSDGAPAVVTRQPDTPALVIEQGVRTTASDDDVDIQLDRLPGSRVLKVSGSIPSGHAEVVRTVSVDNPTLYAAAAFRQALIAAGITVTGEACDIDDLPAPPDRSAARLLLTHTSPPLAAIVTVLLKVSQNLYADTLLKVLGRSAAPSAVGTAEAGKAVVRDVLKGWGITADRYVMADGSGLSRYNYVSADMLVTILTHMYEDARHRQPFISALPLAGVDGTIAGRMKDSAAAGNARGKTGSISNARALSGYVTSAGGEPLVYSMIVNNFNVPQSEADAMIDRAVVRLAVFRR